MTSLTAQPASRTLRRLPWGLGALMLALYLLTLNHWISPASLSLVSRCEGLTWNHPVHEPVTCLLTLPLTWLPAAWIPLAANLLTAACAALSLAWLARCVGLLPYRAAGTPGQWQMQFKPPELLVVRAAWLPPLLAVLAAGLQSSFWQHAIVASGEMVNLLLFAYVVRAVLEFNASGQDSWLFRGSFVYGLAIANDWVAAVFAPMFLLALLWAKRIAIFNEAFLKQLFRRPHSFKLGRLWQLPVCWLAGFAFVVLPPAMASLSATAPTPFWAVLGQTGHEYVSLIHHYPRPLLLITAFVCLMPFLLGAVRAWEAPAGRTSLDFLIGPVFFELVRAFFLLACVWMMLDCPLSPRRLAPSLASLPLYFLGALNMAYVAGHFLMVAEPGPGPAPQRQRGYTPRERREQQIQRFASQVKRAVPPVLLLLTLGLPAGLAAKNLPLISRKRADACGEYINRIAQSPPPAGSVILDTSPFRLIYLQSALIRSGRQQDYLLLDAEACADPVYRAFLERSNPAFAADLETTGPAGDPEGIVLQWLQQLSRTHPIYSLPPAPLADVLGEVFYAQPDHLLERLVPYGLNREFVPALPPDLLRDNATFWQNFAREQLPGLLRRASPPPPPTGGGLSRRFLDTLRFRPEADGEAQVAGVFYATALNDWGVELQRAGKFAEAQPCFAEALQLSPDNHAAQINYGFNTNYLAHGTAVMQSALETAESMREYGDWRNVLRDGAVDEPNFCFMLGSFAAQNQLNRTALAQFEHVRRLTPARTDTYISLARIFVQRDDYVNALTAVRALLDICPTNQEGLILQAGVHMHTKAYLAAIPSLTALLELDPTNAIVRMNRARAYHNTGQFAAARLDDYALLQSATNAFSAYYDLAQMADAETNRPEAIRNYQLFLQYCPTNLTEIPAVRARLKALRNASP